MPRREEYTVGWVCALPIELAAAKAMLDERHNDMERSISDSDENIYCTGMLAGHNVVIVCLPAGHVGNSPAAAVATQMQAMFRGIRYRLMVGVGGGVPSAEVDIRLGDVVVSQPHQTFNGVVQYDLGKTTARGFERTGFLDSPPPILLNAVSIVRANAALGESTLFDHVSKLESFPEFQHSKTGPDVLFEAAYNHEGGPTCEKCVSNRQQTRIQRESERRVTVHYGTIASGNQVMRTAVERDKVSDDLGGVLCFEMEAAGLMNNFRCLVIRGICDYADSHKNKRWQAYAAGTAAAYAKELLSTIPVANVDGQRTMRDAVDVLADTSYPKEFEMKATLADLARGRPEVLEWQHSVVDLLKLLNLHFDEKFRKWLADSLHVRAGLNGSKNQNNALYRAIMKELVAVEMEWKELAGLRLQQRRCLNCGGRRHQEWQCKSECGKCMTTFSVCEPSG